MGAPSGAPGLNPGEGKKTEMEQVETTRKVLVMRDPLKHLEMMAGHLGESGRAPGIYPTVSLAGDRLEVLSFRGFGNKEFLQQLLVENICPQGLQGYVRAQALGPPGSELPSSQCFGQYWITAHPVCRKSTPKISTDLLSEFKGENKMCSHLVGTKESC